jgi:hypothetical protein
MHVRGLTVGGRVLVLAEPLLCAPQLSQCRHTALEGVLHEQTRVGEGADGGTKALPHLATLSQAQLQLWQVCRSAHHPSPVRLQSRL